MNQSFSRDAGRTPLTRTLKLSEIEDEATKTLEVSTTECEGIKSLLDLLALETLVFTYRLRHGRDGRVHVSGRLTGKAVQTCVVTLDPVPVSVDVPVEMEFWPASMISDLERNADDPAGAGLIDWPERIDGDTIDLGPLVYETLATSLEPYPRKSGAHFQWSQNDEPKVENGPFAGLKRLKGS